MDSVNDAVISLAVSDFRPKQAEPLHTTETQEYDMWS